MRIQWHNSKKKKLAEFIDNNADTEEAMQFFSTSRDSIRMAVYRIGGFIRNEKLYWKPNKIAPKVAVKTTIKDRVKAVLADIDNLQKEGTIFTMRDNKLIVMIDINSL